MSFTSLRRRKLPTEAFILTLIFYINKNFYLQYYIPWEAWEFTPVESSKVASLALLALQATELIEAGSTLQATKCKNLPNL